MSYTIGKLKRKRSDGTQYWSYCMMWHEGGGRKRITLNTEDRPSAEARARKAWAERDKGIAVTSNTVGACVTFYLDNLNGLKDERRKREAWAAASPFWSVIHVNDVDAQMSASYMAWRKRAVNTMRNELSLVRTALHAMYRNDAPTGLVGHAGRGRKLTA